jgi:hypothetical protein
MRDVPVLPHCSLLKNILHRNRPVCWSIVMNEKPSVGSPFFGAFRIDLIPQATKDVDFPHTAIPLSYNSKFREHFKATTYFIVLA